jgi:hypothetical protein
MDTIRCTDCYEENEAARERCARCGRLLEKRPRMQEKYEIQHADAPNVMSERNRRVKEIKRNTVW